MQSHDQNPYDSGEDSDILEVEVIPPKNVTSSKSSTTPPLPSSPPASPPASPPPKRRRSSPLLDPLPTYNPTPLHLLQRNYTDSSSTSSSYYTANNESMNDYNSYSYSPNSGPYSTTTTKRSNNDEYVPLLHPSPDVIGPYNDDPSPPRPRTTRLEHATITSVTQATKPTKSATRKPANPRTNRPSVAAVARAIASRSLSQDKLTLGVEEAARSVSAYTDPTTSATNIEKPVMWSPKPPSEIEPVRDEVAERAKAEAEAIKQQQQLANRKPRTTGVTRIAHKPTNPVQKSKRPRVPRGVTKKVPAYYRTRYLDVIIDEYLAAGRGEDESYEKGLSDENGIAMRAANKNIYVNLIARLKKQIRDGVSNTSKTVTGEPDSNSAQQTTEGQTGA